MHAVAGVSPYIPNAAIIENEVLAFDGGQMALNDALLVQRDRLDLLRERTSRENEPMHCIVIGDEFLEFSRAMFESVVLGLQQRLGDILFIRVACGEHVAPLGLVCEVFLHGDFYETCQLAIGRFCKKNGTACALVDPSPWNLGGPGDAYFNTARVAEVDYVGLVVVGLLPFCIAQGHSFVDAAELGMNDAFHGQWRRLKRVKGHSVPVCLADGLAGNGAVNLAGVFDPKRLAHSSEQGLVRHGVENVPGLPGIFNPTILKSVTLQLSDVAFSLHPAFGPFDWAINFQQIKTTHEKIDTPGRLVCGHNGFRTV